MKKAKLILLIFLLLIGNNVYATGGGLRKNSIKTCPDGVTYGIHGDGNGGTHWHVAATNDVNYYAIGEAIYYDPCPDSNKNEGTAGHTSGSKNEQHTSYEEPAYVPVEQETPQIVETTPEQNIESTNVVQEEITEQPIVEKKSTESAETKTEKKKDEKIDLTIKSLMVNDKIVKFNSYNKANDSVLAWDNKVNIDYKLNNYKGIFKIYKDNKEIKDINSISLSKGKNIFIIKISDDKGNELQYELIIEKQSLLYSIFIIIIAFSIIGGISYGIYKLIKYIINKKR